MGKFKKGRNQSPNIGLGKNSPKKSPKDKVLAKKKITQVLQQQGIIHAGKLPTKKLSDSTINSSAYAENLNTSNSLNKRKSTLSKTPNAKKTRVENISQNNKMSENKNPSNNNVIKTEINGKAQKKLLQSNKNNVQNQVKKPIAQSSTTSNKNGIRIDNITKKKNKKKHQNKVETSNGSKKTESKSNKTNGKLEKISQTANKEFIASSEKTNLSKPIENGNSSKSKKLGNTLKSAANTTIFKKSKETTKLKNLKIKSDESDSNDESYIDKFFEDDDMSTNVPEESSIDGDSSDDDSEDDSTDLPDVDEDEPESEIPLTNIIDFYGQFKDQDGLPSVENDENGSSQGAVSNELVPFNGHEKNASKTDTDSSEWESDDTTDVSDTSCSSVSFSDDYSPDTEDSLDHEIYSDHTSNSESYDEDYHPSFEDVIVPKGTADAYDERLQDVDFDTDCSEGQIIEMPNDDNKKASNTVETNNGDESDDSCPQLVPIDQSNMDTVEGYDSYSDSDSNSCCSHESCGCSLSSDEFLEDMTPSIIKCDAKKKCKVPNSISILKDDTSDDGDNIDERIFDLTTMNELDEAQISCIRMDSEEDQDNDNNSVSEDDNEERQIERSIEKPTKQHEDNILQEINKSFFFINSKSTPQVLLLLKSNIFFHGVLKVTLIAGSAQCFGYNLQMNTPIFAYSVRGKSLLSLNPGREFKCTSVQNARPRLTNELNNSLTKLRANFSAKHDAIVLLERCDNQNRMDSVRRYMKENVFPNSNSFDAHSFIFESQRMLNCQFMANPVRALRTNPEWKAIRAMQKDSRMVIVGGKGAGKSTLSKYLINSNLDITPTILLLDLDIGQPECWLPQTVNASIITRPLLGDGVFHDVTPVKSYFYGNINVTLEPLKYINCVKGLVDFCHLNYPNIPWVVNTMGFTKGIGIELIQLIIKLVCPTDVIDIKALKETEDFEMDLTSSFVNNNRLRILDPADIELSEDIECDYHFYSFQSASCISGRGEWIASPLDCRLCNIFAHLGSILPSNDSLLTSVRPVCAGLTELNVITADGDDVEKEMYLDLLNANLVYLCHTSNEYNCSTPAECFGIGIVRAVNYDLQQVYLLPTCSREVLCKVNTLAVSSIPLPANIFLTNISETADTMPYIYNMQDYAGSKQVVQITHRPGQ